MRINLDRLSTLAGIPNGKPSINENVEAGMEETMYEDEDITFEGDGMEEDEDITFEGDGMEEEDEGMEEMIEIDEVMLVQELRRAKRLMNESRQSKAKKQAIFENNLKRIIDEEVQSVMDEMNLTSGWVYGNNTPKRSRKGYTAQGSMIPGIGFQRR
tara:strand:+ start:146 stop:616 length:471 start_codon:yes stop_codon:yes gene_type:complete